MHESEMMLVNPMMHEFGVMEHLNMAFKYFPRKDSILHHNLEQQPDFILNDNNIVVVYSDIAMRVSQPDHLPKKLSGVRQFYPKEQFIILFNLQGYETLPHEILTALTVLQF